MDVLNVYRPGLCSQCQAEAAEVPAQSFVVVDSECPSAGVCQVPTHWLICRSCRPCRPQKLSGLMSSDSFMSDWLNEREGSTGLPSCIHLLTGIKCSVMLMPARLSGTCGHLAASGSSIAPTMHFVSSAACVGQPAPGAFQGTLL